jgi:hypothetical protein
MRAALTAVFLFAAAVSPIGVAAQDEEHPPDPGCALPKINEMVRSVFGPFAAAYHTGGSTPGAQSANGKVRIFRKGTVSCMFFRSAPPPSEALFTILNSYANPDDAAKAFKNVTASAKNVHQDGKVQFADSPGKTMAFDGDRLLAEVRWATAKGATNISVSAATLEPIARQLLIPN